jgi:hypothetical protein
MKITQTDHAWREPQIIEYHDNITDIREAAAKYGRSNDTVRLYDDDNTLKAIATWPQGGRAYKYCISPDKADMPGAWKY